MENIIKLQPGDSLDIIFPENFTIDYETSVVDEKGMFRKLILTSPCTGMSAKRWGVQKTMDFYFYNNEMPDKFWFCKWRHLTPESQEKVKEFVKSYNYGED